MDFIHQYHMKRRLEPELDSWARFCCEVLRNFKVVLKVHPTLITRWGSYYKLKGSSLSVTSLPDTTTETIKGFRRCCFRVSDVPKFVVLTQLSVRPTVFRFWLHRRPGTTESLLERNREHRRPQTTLRNHKKLTIYVVRSVSRQKRDTQKRERRETHTSVKGKNIPLVSIS